MSNVVKFNRLREIRHNDQMNTKCLTEIYFFNDSVLGQNGALFMPMYVRGINCLLYLLICLQNCRILLYFITNVIEDNAINQGFFLLEIIQKYHTVATIPKFIKKIVERGKQTLERIEEEITNEQSLTTERTEEEITNEQSPTTERTEEEITNTNYRDNRRGNQE